MFGRRPLCFWGQFVGTYSALAYAAYAGRRRRERPVRCAFAPEASVGRTVAWACPVHAYALALLNERVAIQALRRHQIGEEHLFAALLDDPISPPFLALLTDPWVVHAAARLGSGG